MRVHVPGGIGILYSFGWGGSEFFTLVIDWLHFWNVYPAARVVQGGNLANRSIGRVKVGHISPKGNGGLARVVAFHGMGHSLLAAFPAIRAL